MEMLRAKRARCQAAAGVGNKSWAQGNWNVPKSLSAIYSSSSQLSEGASKEPLHCDLILKRSALQ